jgi:hypothetical protein
VLVAMFTLITGSIFSITLQQSKQDESTYIIQQLDNTTGLTQAYTRIQDQGSNLTERFIFNCIGTLITCVDDPTNNRTNMTVIGDGVGGGGLTGSGVTNRITKWTNSTNLTTSNIFDNGTFIGAFTSLDSSATSKLYVNGSIAFRTIEVKGSDVTLGNSDIVALCNPDSASPDINLPDLTTVKNRMYIIKVIDKNDSGNCTLTAFSGQEIADLGSTESMGYLGLSTLYSELTIQSNGTAWNILDYTNNHEDLVGQWTKQRTFTNIGTSFIDIHGDLTNGAGLPTFLDTQEKTKIRLNVQWNKIGTGTQTVQLILCTNFQCTATSSVIVSLDVVSGNNNILTNIPSNMINSIGWFKLQAKSTVAGDDPVFQGAFVTLR